METQSVRHRVENKKETVRPIKKPMVLRRVEKNGREHLWFCTASKKTEIVRPMETQMVLHRVDNQKATVTTPMILFFVRGASISNLYKCDREN